MAKTLHWVQSHAKPEVPKDPEHKTLTQKWEHLKEEMEQPDDSAEGTQARLDNIDNILKDMEEFLLEKKERVLPKGVK